MKSASAEKNLKHYIYDRQLQFLETVAEPNTSQSSLDEIDVLQAEVEEDDQNTKIVEDQDDSIELPAETEKWKRKRNTGSTTRSKINKSNQNFEEQFLTVFQTSLQEDEDRSFLESLLPTLRQFNGDQKLLFRSKVIQDLMEIKKMSPVAPASSLGAKTSSVSTK
ncbi:unnamed protein product [Macrosiphum euphorbiae]|uniref:BESS domain-containing protein n=1 Tax=Macrosiphum euphorbiae TaxID=13131 RepID=A0AAV0XYH8_9HEMI|nr:unnamed protein product [Macrosiphum euphorbiae]